MTNTFYCFRKTSVAACTLLGVLVALAPSAKAGKIFRRAQAVVPGYAQQAPPVTYYSASVATTYAAQAPVATTYAAQAPVVTTYAAQAPVATTYAAQAPAAWQVYSTPVPMTYQVKQAPGPQLQYQAL